MVWSRSRRRAAGRGRGVLVRSVAVTNAKGGVGKSTTAINLAAALVELDQRVLLIDADPSGNAALGFFPRGSRRSAWPTRCSTSMRLDEVAVASAIRAWTWCPPAIGSAAARSRWGARRAWARGASSASAACSRGSNGYDVVVVDTSPVLTPLNVAILYAVAEILIPIDPCVAALAGVRALEDLVRTVSEFRMEFTDAGPLTIAGVLITRADRTLVSKQIESEVRAYFGPLVYEQVVPASVKFREAYARGTPLIHYDRFSAGAEAYRAAAQAYLAGGRLRHRRPSAVRGAAAEGILTGPG